MTPYHGGDVSLRDQLPLIMNIIRRDVASTRMPLLIFALVSVALFIFFSILTQSIGRYDSGTEDWNALNILAMYGITVFFEMLIFLGVWYELYSVEVKRGTIRSLSLYPLNMNGITIAKVASTSIVATLASTIFYFSVFGPFMFEGLFHPGGVILIHLTSISCSLFILVTAAFGSHIFIFITRSMRLGGSTTTSLLFMLAFFMSEYMIKLLGMIGSVFSGSYDEVALQNTADAWSQLSVYHSGGRWINMILLDTDYGLDLYIVLPVGLLAILLGYLCGRKIYLDVFIKD